MKIIDLTLPFLPNHVRWKGEQTVKGDTAAGDLFQVTTIRMSCHSFTHVDAKCHYFAGAPTIDQTPLDALVGKAKVVDLKDVGPNQEIGPYLLAERSRHVHAGDKVILASGWHGHRSFETEAFWREAPYLSRAGAEWLLDRGVSTVCYDFPQDYVIRLLLDGDVRPLPEHVTHDVLLRNGVHMVEYLTNTREITASEVFLSAAPLKLPNADGAPARVYVIEGLFD